MNSLSLRSCVDNGERFMGKRLGRNTRKSLVTGGPHSARLVAVNGAQPGLERVVGPVRCAAKCSTRKPSGSRQ